MIKQIFTTLLYSLIAINVFGQQNFFNVPSSNITEKKKIFFQQQINLYETNIASNSTLCYGLGRDYEIGLNILGITYDTDKKYLISNSKNEVPVFPSIGVNGQKKIFAFKKYSIALGSQILLPSQFKNYEWYLYLNNKIEIKNINLVVGLYSGNNNYFGRETKFTKGIQFIGFQFGVEYQIIKDKLYIQSDFISGETNISNLIFGAAYKLNKKWIVSSGYQISNTNNSSLNGLIFELTFMQ